MTFSILALQSCVCMQNLNEGTKECITSYEVALSLPYNTLDMKGASHCFMTRPYVLELTLMQLYLLGIKNFKPNFKKITFDPTNNC